MALIIPAYNEEARLPETLPAAVEHLEGGGRSWEIRVVDDGSNDATAAVVEALAKDEARIVLQREPHRGKGGAVKAGMLASSAAFRFLCDADFSMPVDQVERFVPPRLQGFDLAIATREGPGAHRIGEPNSRHLLGRGFNLLIQALLLPGIEDSQCGFKCFTGQAAEYLFSRQTLEGFAFDVEILYLAHQADMQVAEVPIPWLYMDHSSVKPLRDTWRMLREVLIIRSNDLRGRYR